MYPTALGLAQHLDESVRNILDEVHRGSFSVYLVVSGAGTRAVSWLFAEPGASKTVLEVLIPYSKTAFDNFIGAQPDNYVSVATASKLAKIAHKRAMQLSKGTTQTIGIACTGALCTTPARRGDDELATAYYDGKNGDAYAIKLNSKQSRAQQEEQASLVCINTIAKALGIPQQIELND